MKNGEVTELEIFNKINDFNKKIYRVDNYMRRLFFDNVNMDSDSEILPPIVSTKGYSEFERINYEIKSLKLRIKEINKQLENMQCFTNLVIESLEGRGLSKEEYAQARAEMFGKIELDLREQQKACLEKIASIESNPLVYLRFLEFQACDFSSVSDKDVREKLEQLNGVLKGYTNERNSLLKKYKKYEKNNERCTLKLKPKSNKRGIDKQQ